tara:strand:- start:90 stop:473 length:384 start_codon:yes stop_codon:yes gene_type:complete
MSKEVKLTDKQKEFCKSYVLDWNASRAARDVGYSEKTSKEIGYNLLTKVHIQQYIEEIQKDLSKLAGVSALGNIKKLMLIELKAEKDSDKIKALEVTNKMLGFNAPEKVEQTVTKKKGRKVNWKKTK